MDTKDFWEHINEIRKKKHNFTIEDIIVGSNQLGHPLKVSDVQDFVKKSGDRNSEIITPKQVASFIADMASNLEIKTVFDPHAEYGTLINPVANNQTTTVTTALNPSNSANETAKLIMGSDKIDFITGDPLDTTRSLTTEFDLVTSHLPLGMAPQKRNFVINGETIEIKDDFGHVLMLEACLKMSNYGTGAFLVTPSFTWANKSFGVYKNLNKFGLYMHACISVPAGALMPSTSIPTSLVVIKKEVTKKLFVAELSEDTRRNKEIIDNFIEFKNGEELTLGKIVDLKEYVSFNKLVEEHKIEKLKTKWAYPEIKFDEIVREINTYKKEIENGFVSKRNCIYLPTIGKRSAVASLESLEMKPQNYFQLVIDGEKADVQFVIRYLSTPLGRSYRAKALSGTIIPKLTIKTIREIKFHLPPLEKQLEIIKLDTQTQSVVNEYSELKESIWEKPEDIEDVKRKVNSKSVDSEESFMEWVNTLPFPLASILNQYDAEKGNYRKQYELLDDYFEAVAQYLGLVVFSALRNNNEIYNLEKEAIKRTLNNNNHTFKRSSFGLWVNVLARLSKTIRNIMFSGKKDTSEREVLQLMLDIFDEEMLEKITSVELIKILQETNNMRNDGPSHGGILSEDAARQRCIDLENKVERIRAIFGKSWENYCLIKPISMTYKQGIYTNVVYTSKGLVIPFRKNEVETSEPFIDDQIYLLNKENAKHLKLMEFIKIIENVSACYFYSKIKNGKLKYVSYHYEMNPEIEFDGIDEIMEIIDEYRF